LARHQRRLDFPEEGDCAYANFQGHASGCQETLMAEGQMAKQLSGKSHKRVFYILLICLIAEVSLRFAFRKSPGFGIDL
jgi:hypothetical protein